VLHIQRTMVKRIWVEPTRSTNINTPTEGMTSLNHGGKFVYLPLPRAFSTCR
jgi:hypothetical protein